MLKTRSRIVATFYAETVDIEVALNDTARLDGKVEAHPEALRLVRAVTAAASTSPGGTHPAPG